MFRERYLSYEELTAQLRAWTDAHPDLCRLDSLGVTPEGRDIWVLTIGAEPERARPAVWIDGNMHAAEVCGSSVALAIAADVIRLHTEPDAELHALPAHVRERLRELLFYVVPRISPDGAECVLTSGRYVRSAPRDDRTQRSHPRWIAGDVDGDGKALVMRMEDPGGEFVESREVPNLMVLRELDDEGPYYKIYPEGSIEHFDGHTIPSPEMLSDNRVDLNRNFPWSWAHESEQMGAGAFPASEPESRAIVEFTSRRPHIFAWLNLHTFGGVFIRPLGNEPDNKMDQNDLALFRQIAAWAEEHTGYPTVSGYQEFLYEPDKPLRGDLTDYAYHQRGCIAYCVELWDLFTRLGWDRQKRFVDNYDHVTREKMEQLARWDAEHNHGRVVLPWQRVDHPQLGEVEVGGIDPRVGLWNPPYENLAEVCNQQSACFLRVAALAPALRFGAVDTEAIADGATRVTVTVDNHGYLPTYVLSSARELDFNEPLYCDVDADGCTLADPGDRHRAVGHLDGWGRGLHDGTGALYYMRSRGNTSSRTLTFTVTGSGSLRLRVGSSRTGWIERVVDIDAT